MLTYRRELDGLRAVAVLPVILFHAGFKAFPGGFVGVDVFYVISGYLITSILLRDLREGKFSLVTFYERRARRILPALFVVLLACIPFAYLWLLPNEFAGFWESVVSVATFTSNIHFYNKLDYFSPSAENDLLLHTWSLAVEEQFYLLFPIYLFLAWRLRRPWFILVTAALTLGSFGIALWGARNYPAANFYLLPGRGWELMVGAGIAYWHRSRSATLPAMARQAAAITGLCGILGSVVLFQGSTTIPPYLMAIPVLGAGLIIAFADGQDVVSRALSWRPVVFIGLISYSAYLWHQPLFALLRMRSFGEARLLHWLLAILACLGLAAITWRYVERPFRAQGPDRRPLVPRGTIFAASAAGLAALAVTGFAAARSDRGIETVRREGVGKECLEAVDIHDCPPKFANGPKIVLWGDSYADAFAPALLEAGAKAGLSVYPRLYHSCPSLLGTVRNEELRMGRRFAPRCIAYTQRTRAFIENFRPDVVVLANAYAWYASSRNTENGLPILQSKADPNLDGREVVLASIEETVRFLNGAGAAVVLVAPYPRLSGNAFRAARRRALITGRTGDAFAVDPGPARELTREIQERLHGLNARIISLDGIFCRKACSVLDSAGNHLTFDGSHLSPYAAERLAAMVVHSAIANEATQVSE